MPDARKKLNPKQRVRVAKKIATMRREEGEKPEGERRDNDQIYAIAYNMEKEGKLT